MTGEAMVSLGEVAEYQTGFPFKSKEYSADGVKLLRGDNIGQGYLRWDGAKFWSVERSIETTKFALREDDVILAMDRPWIEAGLKYAAVSTTDLPCILVQRVARLRGTEKIDGKYLRYVIGSADFTAHIQNITTGTAVPHISGKDILSYKFLLPSISLQREIAATLGALDNKIELNRKTAATLEEMARALYRSWFVDFDPVRARAEGRVPAHMDAATAALFPDSFGEDDGLPVGWEMSTIGGVAEIVGGSTPSTRENRHWGDGENAWATPKDLSNLGQAFLFETERSVTSAGLAKITSGLSPAGTLLLSSRAPIGYLALTTMPVAVNQGFIAIRETTRISGVEAYFWCFENMDLIHANANGSTFQEISKKNFRPLAYVLGSAPVRTTFNKQAGLWFAKMRALMDENRTLATLRDTLLPRLMSGELRVAATRELIEEVA